VSAAPVCVTGGSGFVGGAVLRRLVSDGRRVRALVRSEAAARVTRDLGAEPILGDVLDAESLARVFEGCQAVYHVAGVNALCRRDPRPMLRVNVDGSRNVVLSAARAGVRRIVYTSSAATIGELPGRLGREDSRHRGTYLSSYERSKVLAERAVFQSAAETGVEVVSMNPASVQGPGRTSGTARLFLAAANGRLPFVVDTVFGVVDVADCTEGHVRAEQHGLPGERYVLCGAVLTARRAIDLLASVARVPIRTHRLPGPAALAGAAAVQGAMRLIGRDPPVCREMIRTLLHGHRYDGSKAARELGIRYTPIEETLLRTLAWFDQQGLLTRPLPGLSHRDVEGK